MPDRVRAFGPGRVNLIGEHTDYNGGLALPFAVAAGVTVTATARDDGQVEARALDLAEDDGFSVDHAERASGWRAFVRGTVAEVRAAGYALGGATLSITGTIPQGAGLSSSAALEVALSLALIALSGHDPPDAVAVAELCSRVEHDWVGARTGLLDQLASLCGRDGHGVLIDFEAMTMQPVAIELGDHRLFTLDSGERHTIAGSGYNERREQCEEACRRLGVATLRQATPGAVATLPEPLRRRARHVLSENDRVRAAVEAVRNGDMPSLGSLLSASHASLRDDYEVSTPAVEATVTRLLEAGALGARLVGGGFGGNVLGVLPPGARPPHGALQVGPSAGARVLTDS